MTDPVMDRPRSAGAPTPAELEVLRKATLRLRLGSVAVVMSLVGAASWFAVPAWLLAHGIHVDQPLSVFLPGYRVSWLGCLSGLGYGAFLGGIAGVAIGWVYNGVAAQRGRFQD